MHRYTSHLDTSRLDTSHLDTSEIRTVAPPALAAGHDDRPVGRMSTRAVIAKVAALVLTTGIGIGAFTAPVHAGAAPNDDGRNCHGVWLSYLSTSDMAPGQLHHDYGASVQDVQATADIVCGW